MSTEEKEGKARNEEIENQLKRDKMMQRNEIKMLLLGMFLDPICQYARQVLFFLHAAQCRVGVLGFHQEATLTMTLKVLVNLVNLPF